MKSLSATKAALRAIADKAPDGLLRPSAVVKAARNERSPLHSHFTWDDSVAGERWRLQEARTLIRSVYVTNPQDIGKRPEYVSLIPDRDPKGGGYRTTSEVIDDDDLREQLIVTAKTELRGWMKRYKMLTELVGPVAEAAGIDIDEGVLVK